MLKVGDIKEFSFLEHVFLGICLDINETNIVLGYIANKFYLDSLKLSNIKYKDIKIEPDIQKYFNTILDLYNEKKRINKDIKKLENELNNQNAQKQSFFNKLLKTSPTEDNIDLQISINNKKVEETAVLSRMETVGNNCLDCYIKLKGLNMEKLNSHTINKGQIKEFIEKGYNSKVFVGICLSIDYYGNNSSFPSYIPDIPTMVILSIESENGKYSIQKRELDTMSNNYLIKDIRFSTPGLRDNLYQIYTLENKIMEFTEKYNNIMSHMSETSLLNQGSLPLQKDLIILEKKINNMQKKLKETEKIVLELYSKEINR